MTTTIDATVRECPHCSQQNRLPVTLAPGKRVRCGACKATLATTPDELLELLADDTDDDTDDDGDE
jgi:hypothetical protein